MATAWPSIQAPDFPLKTDVDDPTIRSNFEDGSQQTRARFTTIKETFSLSWAAMTASDLSSLLTFYKTTVVGGAGDIAWTHPDSGTSYTVRFNEALQYRLVAPGIYEVQAVLREV